MVPRPTTAPDSVLEAEVERAVAPYRGVVSPEVLHHMKERLREELSFHPVARRFLNRVRPVPVLQQSDEIRERDPAKTADRGAAQKRGKAGGKGT